MATEKRIVIYHHYDRDNVVDPYVLYQLKAFRDFGIELIFVSHSQLPVSEVDNAKALCGEVLLRANRGFDWGAWQEVLLGHKRTFWEQYDEVLLANCSCYGPFIPMSNLFGRMNETNTDFWTITEHLEVPGFPPHGQSYFFVFAKRLVASDTFWRFWQRLPEAQSYWEAVWCGEIGLSQTFVKAGFKRNAWVDLSDWQNQPPCVFRDALRLLRETQMPFVKVKAIQGHRDNGLSADTLADVLSAQGSLYPVTLVREHLFRCPDTLVQDRVVTTFTRCKNWLMRWTVARSMYLGRMVAWYQCRRHGVPYAGK